jgi:hypothetical protein
VPTWRDQFLDQFIVEKDRMLASAEELEIELGAVIFADGMSEDTAYWRVRPPSPWSKPPTEMTLRSA